MKPIVIVEIDENSRIRVLQTDGVRVGFVDRRIDGEHVTILPEQDDWDTISKAIDRLVLISPKRDDPARTAAETIRRIGAGEIVVVGFTGMKIDR